MFTEFKITFLCCEILAYVLLVNTLCLSVWNFSGGSQQLGEHRNAKTKHAEFYVGRIIQITLVSTLYPKFPVLERLR